MSNPAPNVKLLNGQAQMLLSHLWAKQIVLQSQINQIAFVDYSSAYDRIHDQAKAILDLTVDTAEPIEEFEHTVCSYCSSCTRDFDHLEFVHFIVWDNNCVCTTCSKNIDAEKEPRMYVKAGV